MYKVKSKGNYNVVVGDIGITVFASNDKGVLVSEEDISKSSELHRLVSQGYLTLEKVDDVKPKTSSTEASKAATNKSTPSTFVADGKDSVNPDDVFVAHDEKPTDDNVAHVQTHIEEHSDAVKVQQKETKKDVAESASKKQTAKGSSKGKSTNGAGSPSKTKANPVKNTEGSKS